MEKEQKNNKRTANYTKEECWRLIEIIEKFAHIIENKKTDALTWKDKKTAWQKVCLQFNAVGTQNRIWEQLRSKYETLKKETRRAVAKCRTDILGTGGGPFEAKPVNPLYEKIRAIIKLSADGTPSRFDSDYIDAEMTGNVSTCFNTPILIDTQTSINDDCQEESLLVVADMPCTSDTLSITNNESNHVVTQMKKAKSPDLQLQQLHKAHEHANTCITPTVLAGFTPLTACTEGTSKALSAVETNSEADIPEVNNWTSYCPAQLKRPKHPALQTPKRKRSNDRNISVAGQKMQPWVDAKAELTTLKLKLIQENFNIKQQRKRELHEQQLQLNNQQIKINELIIEKLELEIKNMEK